jgi:DNA-binding response OmpR family regulator
MKKILVVDDDQAARTLLKEILTAEKWEVVEAEDGQKALDMLQAQKIDLVITDRSMPAMDGLVLLKTLSEKRSTVPVIMVSAYGEEELWGQAIQLGAKEYLLKPFKAQDVLNVVRRFL